MRIILLSILITIISLQSENRMTFEEATKGTKAPQDLLDSLVLLNVKHYDLNGKVQTGQIIVSKVIEKDALEMFQMMFDMKFPIEKMQPIVAYNWSDDRSMEANNTSAFNYRFIAGTTRLSNHSFGRALDINPRMNPVYYNDGRMSPKNGTRDTTKPGTFHKDHPIVKEFKKRGFRWGGDWTSLKDYHHFDKP